MAGGYHLFASGEVLTAANANNFLMNQTVMVFASAAARTTALSGVLAEGMVSYRTDSHIAEYYNGSAWTAFTSSGSGINRNALLNADFQINQRGFTSNTTTGAYNFDRWFQQNSGGTCTVTPQTFTPGTAPIGGTYEGRNFVQLVTATQAAAGDYAILTQRIEDVTKFAGQSITLSFFAKAGTGTPSIGLEIQQNFGTGGSPSATVSTPISAQAITTSWARYNVTVTVPSITGKTLGTTANTSYLEVNLWISSGATNATRASSIGIQNGTFSIFGVKLEAGSTATAFSIAHPSLEAEMAACQRYYWRSTTQLMSGFANSTTVAYCAVQMPVTMRATPTLGTDGTAGNYIVQIPGSTGSGSSVVPSIGIVSSVQNLHLLFTLSSGLTAGWGVQCRTSSYLEYIAEL